MLILLLLFQVVFSKNAYELSVTNTNSTTIEADVNFIGDFNIKDYELPNLNPDADIILKTELKFSASLEANSTIHVRIAPYDEDRWKADPWIVSPKYNPTPDQDDQLDTSIFTINEFPFGFEIKEKSIGTVLYSTTASNNFLFTDTLIINRAYIRTDGVYGLGERTHSIKLGEGLWTIGNNDTFAVYEDDGTGGHSLYSSGPFYWFRSENTYFGCLTVTTNIHDNHIQKYENSLTLEQRITGGILDYYFFQGTSPMEVIRKLHYVIGFPTLPPYWALGWHQTRFGYRSDKELRTVWQTYKDKNMPLDALWADIDYMQDYRCFTIDPVRYGKLPDLVKDVHNNNQRFVPIVDIGIARMKGDAAYDEGSRLGIWIQSNYTNTELVNIVWPGDSVYPDWFNPATEGYWKTKLKELDDKLNFDGIWLDMNEPASRLNDVGKGELASSYDKSKNTYRNIPYVPGGGNSDLDTHVVSANALNYGYKNKKYMTQYNTRPLNSFLQNTATYEYLATKGERPFILSRSALIGLGRMAGHWVADDFSNYTYLQHSISQTMTFGFLGFNIMGADICGINTNATDKLCARWHAVGAFYPLARNHNSDKATSQEPYAFGDNSFTMKAFLTNIRVRYNILRYISSSMLKDTLQGGFFFRPLFMEFPNEELSWEQGEQVIMLGPSLLFAPILQESEESFKRKLPNGRWANLLSGEIKVGDVDMPAQFDSVNIFLREGSIIPYQEREKSFLNTEELADNEIMLLVNPKEGSANGEFYLNGNEIITSEDEVIKVAVKFGECRLEIRPTLSRRYVSKDRFLTKVRFLGSALNCFREKNESVKDFDLAFPIDLATQGLKVVEIA